MLLLTYWILPVVLLVGSGQPWPGVPSKRQEISIANFEIDPARCKRDQGQKDLITTELGIARDMAKAAADASSDSLDKWSKYFFDDDTNGTPDTIKSYYSSLSQLYDDSSYKVKIYCPVEGDKAYSDCKNGRVWATTFAFGTNKHIIICPIWFDGIDEDTVKQDSSVVKANCPKGAKGEKNWEQIASFKGIKSFTMLHEKTHLNYATKSDGVPVAQNNRSLDYSYGRPDCKKLRDGVHANSLLCKEFPFSICPATKSFRNADTLAFVASGIYWERECDKSIAIEPEAGVTENNDPALNDDEDAGPDEPEDSVPSSPTTTQPPTNTIGPLSDCSLVQTTIEAGPQTYCTCGTIMAGINIKTSDNLVYTVCAGAPYPTVATSTINAPPAETGTVDLGTCETGTFSDPSCDDSCGPGECKSGVTTTGQVYYSCDCP